jgi:phosphocarrier protein
MVIILKEIKYIIQDEVGIHARPAGLLVKKCAEFPCDIRIGRPDKMVDAKRVIGVMSLGMKCGDELCLTFDGDDEEKAADEVAVFLREHL